MNTLLARLPRIELSVEALLLIVVAAATLLLNLPLWQSMRGELSGAAALRVWAPLFVVVVALQFAVLALLVTRLTVRPVLALFIVAGCAAAHFIARLGVIVDPSMMRNVLHTDWREAAELITPALIGSLLLALLAAAALWLVALRAPASTMAALRRRLLAVAAAVLAAGVALWMGYQDISSLMRNRRELRYMVTPANAFWSLGSVLFADAHGAAHAHEPPQPVNRKTPAAQASNQASNAKPLLFVLVVGETARAANFGLNGYPRDTTPELAQLPVINFKRATACGTSTEVSVPCMFSPFGRTDYDEARIRAHESALHLLARAGIDVLWLDNQSGCKGVCNGLPTQDLSRAAEPILCDGEHCFDEILLLGLRRALDAAQSTAPLRDRIVVLHQLGNHGPAYYRRYPPAFKRFTPACESNELRDCSRAQIVNAYDNAIAYTDFVLAQTVRYLQSQQARYDVVFAYASDHGESLGERGLYLHGLPYAIAPREQIEIPMLWWFGAGAAQRLQLDTACLRQRAQEPASHDVLFHSMLGAFAVETPSYRRQRDLFALCAHAT